MPVIRNSGDLVSYINGALPDNNAGQISAADVRNSIVDTVVSINTIVSSGDFNVATPFIKNVRIKRTDGQDTGLLIVESGVVFQGYSNTPQLVPYPGPQSINHNQLSNLNVGDPHPQYVPVSGTRTFTNNTGFGNGWINSSGSSIVETTTGKGLQFSHVSSSRENINVGSGTQFVFLRDQSVMNSARGVAKAWINFDSTSGVTVGKTLYVLDSYNVSGIKRDDTGKFTITFVSGVFKDNNYIAFGWSNGRSTVDSVTDFNECTVSTSYKTGDDASSLRKLGVAVYDKYNNNYINAKLNQIVVFGTEPNGSGNPNITIE